VARETGELPGNLTTGLNAWMLECVYLYNISFLYLRVYIYWQFSFFCMMYSLCGHRNGMSQSSMYMLPHVFVYSSSFLCVCLVSLSVYTRTNICVFSLWICVIQELEDLGFLESHTPHQRYVTRSNIQNFKPSSIQRLNWFKHPKIQTFKHEWFKGGFLESHTPHQRYGYHFIWNSQKVQIFRY
jgi:hypothetical protein